MSIIVTSNHTRVRDWVKNNCRGEIHCYSSILYTTINCPARISQNYSFYIGSRVGCVCVFFPSILDIKFVGRTSRGHTGGRSHRIFNPPSFCGACLDFCREKDSAIPFPRRP